VDKVSSVVWRCLRRLEHVPQKRLDGSSVWRDQPIHFPLKFGDRAQRCSVRHPEVNSSIDCEHTTTPHVLIVRAIAARKQATVRYSVGR
jgi:hypothetical protein